ncbi:hypothetical protein MATL_G00068750 [Megalops atlanticus]|uniref:Uncharacterized protein n=1 Tax=Megalops atlanticus TaxID=7932 RepID=A0A9D3T8Q6_MEGAT|nr:hypothetical protein MATL_G00068750 [Megalops atlanticus]
MEMPPHHFLFFSGDTLCWSKCCSLLHRILICDRSRNCADIGKVRSLSGFRNRLQSLITRKDKRPITLEVIRGFHKVLANTYNCS